MFVPFDTLPGRSRVWIYQSEKKLVDTEKQYIINKATSFIDGWQSHGKDLKGSVEVLYDHFLIIAIDELFSSASGCSIDKSVHFVTELEKELGTSLLSRSKQSYLANNEVHFFPINEAKQLVLSGVLERDTKTFNNNILSKEELETTWIIEAEKSWIGKFFKNSQLSQYQKR